MTHFFNKITHFSDFLGNPFQIMCNVNMLHILSESFSCLSDWQLLHLWHVTIPSCRPASREKKTTAWGMPAIIVSAQCLFYLTDMRFLVCPYLMCVFAVKWRYGSEAAGHCFPFPQMIIPNPRTSSLGSVLTSAQCLLLCLLCCHYQLSTTLLIYILYS